MKKLVIAITMTFLVHGTCFAHPDPPGMPFHGEVMITPIIGGERVFCNNGQPIPTVSNHFLNDAGHSFPGVIHLNPHVLGSYPVMVRLFIYGHECAHHFSLNEAQADCLSIKTGRDQGYFDDSAVMDIGNSLIHSPGDWTHAPGPIRVRQLINCYNQP